MNASHTVIAAYRPKPNCEAALMELVNAHVPRLRELGLASDTPVTTLRSSEDGTVLEIFDWYSQEAVERAHTHPEVQKIWAAFSQVCEYVTLGDLKEAGAPFAHFERL